MAFKTLCLLLIIAVVAYGLPFDQDGFADDPGFGNGQGQGGFLTQGGQGFQGNRNGYDHNHQGVRHGGHGGGGVDEFGY